MARGTGAAGAAVEQANDDLWDATTYATIQEALLDLILKRRLWMHRRVDRIEFVDDIRVRRYVSVDFTVPTWQTYMDATAVLAPGFVLVPVALPRKTVLRGFSITDETGAALPVLTKRQTQRLSSLMLIQRFFAMKGPTSAKGDALPRPQPETLNDLMQLVAIDDPIVADQQRQTLVKRWAKSSDPILRAIPCDEVLPDLMTELARHFILCVLMKGVPGERHVVKFSYEEPLVLNQSEQTLSWRDRLDVVTRLMGWSPVRCDVDVTLGVSESSHLEALMPNELFVERGVLDGPLDESERSQNLVDGPTQRLHLQVRAQESKDCKLVLLFRLQPAGIVTSALLISLLTFMFLVGGLATHLIWGTAPSGDLPAAVLLALPGLFAAYLFGPEQHRLLRKVFTGLQFVVYAVAFVSFLGAAVLAVTRLPGRFWWWVGFTIVAAAATSIVAVAWRRSNLVVKQAIRV